MATVVPFHTTSTEYPTEHRNVHHDRDDCDDGKKIKSTHRKVGENQKPLCDRCIKLGG